MIEFEPEVNEYLALKSKSTRKSYSSDYRIFLQYYKTKYGEDKNFTHFLDRIFENLKKPIREQKKVAETELS